MSWSDVGQPCAHFLAETINVKCHHLSKSETVLLPSFDICLCVMVQTMTQEGSKNIIKLHRHEMQYAEIAMQLMLKNCEIQNLENKYVGENACCECIAFDTNVYKEVRFEAINPVT